MIDLTNETYWQNIKYDVINHIPTIYSGGGYSEWFSTVSLMKRAGLTRDEVAIWCREEGEPNNSTWNGIKIDDDDNGKGKYRGALVKRAKEHGYTLPTLNKRDSLLTSAKQWVRSKSDDEDFIHGFMSQLPSCGDGENTKAFDDMIINEYLKANQTDEQKLNVIKNKIFFTKKNKNGQDELVLNGAALDELIYFLGFRQVNNGEDLDYIRITDNYFIEKMTAKKVKSLIHEECEKIFTPEQYTLIKNSNIIEKERTMNTISIIEPAVHDDTSTSTYFYFKNGVIEVTKDKVVNHKYNIINGYLWRNAYKSINHTFTYTDEAGDFEKFCKNIVSGDDTRFDVLKSVIGYYISRYRRPSMCKCVVLTDRIEEDDASRGGTGKSTIVEALKEVRSVGKINGKSKNQDQRFIFSGYEDGNTIYAIDDITENFDTEALFGFITGSTTVERKYENSIEVFLKHIITSNFVPRNIVAGESYKRRFNVFELDHYYTSTFTPIDEFGREFFSAEWNDEDWNQFYSFLIRCEQTFLADGLKSYTTEGSDEIKLKKSINNVALEFIEDYLIGKHDLNGEKIYIKDLKSEYEEYVKEHNKRYGTTSYKLTGELAKYFGEGYTRDRDMIGRYIMINKDLSPFFANVDDDKKTITPVDNPFDDDDEEEVKEEVKEDTFLSDAPDADGVKTIYVPEGVTLGRCVKGYSVFVNDRLIECDANGKSLDPKYKLVWGTK